MIKKSNAISFLGLFLSVSLLFSALTATMLRSDTGVKAGAPHDAERFIVIDAGHGGIDGGASGADGTLEKELNLAVSKKLAALFRIAGYTVIETRSEDVSLADADAKKGHVKQSDLTNRLNISNKYPDSLLVSIHMNSYKGVPCRGLQVWYSENNENSLAYAKAVQEGVKALLQEGNNRKVKAATSSIYLLRHAENPAILIECGFISNPEECARLTNEDYQRALALAIFASLHQKI